MGRVLMTSWEQGAAARLQDYGTTKAARAVLKSPASGKGEKRGSDLNSFTLARGNASQASVMSYRLIFNCKKLKGLRTTRPWTT